MVCLKDGFGSIRIFVEARCDAWRFRDTPPNWLACSTNYRLNLSVPSWSIGLKLCFTTTMEASITGRSSFTTYYRNVKVTEDTKVPELPVFEVFCRTILAFPRVCWVFKKKCSLKFLAILGFLRHFQILCYSLGFFELLK